MVTIDTSLAGVSLTVTTILYVPLSAAPTKYHSSTSFDAPLAIVTASDMATPFQVTPVTFIAAAEAAIFTATIPIRLAPKSGTVTLAVIVRLVFTLNRSTSEPILLIVIPTPL